MHIATHRIEGGSRRIAFMHGLMGRGRNFTSPAKALADDATSLLIDLPNHGRSDWTRDFDYVEIADEVAEMLRADFGSEEPIVLLGHSLGGKVAMTLALRHPDLLKALIVEDISPTDTGNYSTFDHLLGSLRSVDLQSVSERSEVEEQLAEPIPEDSIRQFLMQNLRRTDRGYQWQPNLEMLYQNLDAIAGFPELTASYEGPVLWIKGEQSNYIDDDSAVVMRELFPKVRKSTVRGANHWVHSEKPQEFVALLKSFLDSLYPTDA